jgi:acyl-CoA dehydrogenase
MRKAVREKKLPKVKGAALLEEAKKAGVLTEAEYNLMKEASQVRYDAIQVDDFSQQQFLENKV